MKKIKLMALALVMGTATLFASNNIPDEPAKNEKPPEKNSFSNSKIFIDKTQENSIITLDMINKLNLQNEITTTKIVLNKVAQNVSSNTNEKLRAKINAFILPDIILKE